MKAVIDSYNKRKLAESFNRVRKLLVEDNNIEKAMEEYINTKEKLTSNVIMEPIDLIQDKSRYEKYIEKTRDFNKYFLGTGFKELDKIIGGIDTEEEFALIVARTNFGKSWVLLKMAVASVLKGKKVGFYSGEMSEFKVGWRFDTLLGHINNSALTHGNIEIQNEYKQYIDGLPNQVNGGQFIPLTPQMLNRFATVDDLKVFIEKYQLDILFVDQIPLLSDKRNGRTETERFSNLAVDLKNLQVLTNIPIICAHQQNRQKNDDGSIDTTNIAGSDNLGRFATLILFIDRPKETEDLMKLIVGKVRDSGGVGKSLSYHIDLNTGTFQYVPENEGDLSVEDDDEDDDDISKRYANDINTSGEDVL